VNAGPSGQPLSTKVAPVHAAARALRDALTKVRR
jgi:hypothetical protein